MPYKLISLVFLLSFLITNKAYSENEFILPVQKPSIFKKIEKRKPDVINAIKLAADLGCRTIGLTGKKCLQFNDICEVNLAIQSHSTPRIQEMHILIEHTLCHLIDLEFKD